MSEQRAKDFCLEKTKFLKTKTVDPFNASEQEKTFGTLAFSLKQNRLMCKG